MLELQVKAAPVAVAIDGTIRLVYELHMASFAAETLTLTRVEILDAETDDVVGGRLVDSDDLAGRLARFATDPTGADPRAIAPGTHTVVYLEITIDADTPPRALSHRVALTGQRAQSEIQIQ